MNKKNDNTCRDPRGDYVDLTEYIDMYTNGFVLNRDEQIKKWKINSIHPKNVLDNKYRWFGDECQIIFNKYARGDTLKSLAPDVAHNIATLSAVYEEAKTYDTLHKLEDGYRVVRLPASFILERLRFGLFVSCLAKDEELIRIYAKSIPEDEDKVLDTLLAKFDSERNIYEYVKYPDVIDDPYYLDLALIEEIIEGCDSEAERRGLVEEYLEAYSKNLDASWPYWCFEIGFVMKVFNFDDSYLENHPHYPWELVKYKA